jgi:hypothetical protein
MTAESITVLVAAILGLAALITAVTVIWNFFKKLKTSIEELMVEILDKELAKVNKQVDDKIKVSVDASKERLDNSVSAMNTKFDLFIDTYHKSCEENGSTIMLLKSSLIEAYKQDIRKIYYKLRETGELNEYDKAYVDKIFPLYRAVGGNSDIEAKYMEMCHVYERRTQEMFDLALQEKKKKQANKANKVKLETALDTVSEEKEEN